MGGSISYWAGAPDGGPFGRWAFEAGVVLPDGGQPVVQVAMFAGDTRLCHVECPLEEGQDLDRLRARLLDQMLAALHAVRETPGCPIPGCHWAGLATLIASRLPGEASDADRLTVAPAPLPDTRPGPWGAMTRWWRRRTGRSPAGTP